MKPQISLITILADDVPSMAKFYTEVLGFKVQSESPSYVALENEGVRFSICARQIMEEATNGHPSYQEAAKGQAFELAFSCESADHVRKTYEELIAKGATPIKEPATMPWGQTTAFFADPEGNIHEIFAD